MRNLFLFITGFVLGIWISWPRIFSYQSWACVFEIIEESKNERISLKTILKVSPKIIFKSNNNDNLTRFRIVSDTCFR